MGDQLIDRFFVTHANVHFTKALLIAEDMDRFCYRYLIVMIQQGLNPLPAVKGSACLHVIPVELRISKGLALKMIGADYEISGWIYPAQCIRCLFKDGRRFVPGRAN